MTTKASSPSSLRLGLAALFEVGARARGAGYDIGVLPVRAVDGAVVISVGNLRAGGSGKTPLAMHLALRLARAGHHPALLLRGYLGRLEHRGGLISTGEEPLVPARDAGDEALLAAKRLRGVVVRVGADRVAGALAAVADGADVIVLDDGFQHRRLHRDLDLLLLTPADLDPATGMLPAGPLREPAAAASRADLLIGLDTDWWGRNDAPEVLLAYEPCGLVSPAWERVDLETHRGARAHLLAGIARPERFVESVTAAGIEIAGSSFFDDHHPYSTRDIEQIAEAARADNAELILTTEKDLARLEGFAFSLLLFALRIDVRITRGAAVLEHHLTGVLGN